MEQPAAASPAIGADGFASILAAFATPAKKPQPDWSLDGLADDVATLSYEQALRTHARYRPAADLPPEQDLLPEQDIPEQRHDQKKLSSKPMTAAKLSSSPSSHSAQVPTTCLDKHRKTASITIRLSNAECAQLHQRAAEAGLTISAYLRSCTCEVEALRAQVKEALAQLRPVTAKDEQKPACTKSAATHGVWARLALRWKSRNEAGF